MKYSVTSKPLFVLDPTSICRYYFCLTRQAGVILLLLGLNLSPLLAQNKIWTGSSSTDWNTSSNWNPTGVPTSANNVTIVTAGNQPVIGAGIAAFANSVEIWGAASLSIASTGSLSVVGSTINTFAMSYAFYNQGTVNNSGLLAVSNSASKSFGIINDATFNNNAASELNIDNTSQIGFWNRKVAATPTLTNAGKIILGTTTSAGTVGMYNEGTIQNNGGQINIDRAGTASIQNLPSTTMVSSGTVTIGKTSSSGIGIYNFGTFRNLTSGLIGIDRTNTAIYNLTQNPSNLTLTSPAAEFTNASKIALGQLANVGSVAIHNLSGATGVVTFVNSTGAEIIIDNTGTGIQNENTSSSSSPSSFTNAGKISIGQTANVSSLGIFNISKSNSPVTFINTTGAEIRVDRTSTGIQNETKSTAPTSFTNAGKIFIGQVATLNTIGIFNVSSGTSVAAVTFINRAGSEITVDRAYVGIQSDERTIFDNAGSIKIGTIATQVFNSPGIMNRSTFTNQATGTIQIERINASGINHGVSTFTNNGTITMGINTTVGNNQPSLINSATLLIGAGAVLQIDHCLGDGIQNNPSASNVFPAFTNALLVNAGLIEIGKNVSGGTHGLRSGESSSGPLSGTLINQPSGIINIDHINGGGSWALYTSGKTFTNAGKITIGNSSSAGNTGLYNYSNFTNSGEISIDHIVGNSSIHGLYNGVSSTTGVLSNTGKIIIGGSASIGDYGLLNDAIITNNVGGEISINRAAKEGLRTQGTSTTFTNAGQLAIGNIASVGDWGLYNSNNAVFNNNAGGKLSINRSAITGLRSDGTSTKFINAGQMAIGNIASVGDWGLWNQASFSNSGGSITVDRSALIGLVNGSFSGGTFTNAASLSIGTLAATSDVGLLNASASTFSNSACATLTLYNSLSNLGTFSNQGLIIVNTAKPHSNAAWTNDGVIDYLQANPIPSVTNNDMIIAPISSSCNLASTSVLQIGGSNSFSAATTWFKDPGLTQPAGTYNAGSNTFTLTSSDAGNQVLWFLVTDNVTNCSQLVSVSVQVYAPVYASIQSLSVSGVIGSPNCVVELTGQATGTSFIFTGPGSYVFSNVYRYPGSYRVFGPGVTQPGVYTLTANSTGDCGLGTPVSQTITVNGTKCP